MQVLVRDAYGRPLKSLRILVTAECNYRCFFCHLEGDPLGAPLRPGLKPPLLSPEDYGVIAEAAYKLGISSFKITGGEPLVRKDIVDIVGSISSSAPGSDISMTTNGFFLDVRARSLADAGLKRVNVSIHSLRRDKYRFITGVDGLERGVRGVKVAVESGLRVKINALILKGVNDDEIFDLVEFARNMGATLQLIELIPVGLGAKLLESHKFPLAVVEEMFKAMGAKVRWRSLHNRPIYELPNGALVEVVSSHGNPIFCAGCDRLRLDASGNLSPCINWRGERINIVKAIREAKSRDEAVKKVMGALLEANTMRRPYYLYTVKTGRLKPSTPSFDIKDLRIRETPKRRLYFKILETGS
ncbi:MAG: GTP 3',8-cyclase MoaA [Thermoprotei archaeon]|nr:GTP 3',8-cyclase MoaA [Thermoprotei archaeon]